MQISERQDKELQGSVDVLHIDVHHDGGPVGDEPVQVRFRKKTTPGDEVLYITPSFFAPKNDEHLGDSLLRVLEEARKLGPVSTATIVTQYFGDQRLHALLCAPDGPYGLEDMRVVVPAGMFHEGSQ